MLTPRKTNIFRKHWALWIWAAIVVVGGAGVVLAGIAAVSTGLVGAHLALSVTENPKFCAVMCHNMRPVYDSWAASTHEGIRCAECHNEPGIKGFLAGAVVAPVKESIQYYITHDYGEKPMVVEMSGRSCFRHECHKFERVEEETALYRGTFFRHGAHIKQSHSGRLNCTSCHTRDEEVHMAVPSDLCFLCHLNSEAEHQAPADCRACHTVVLPTEDMDHAEAFAGEMACEDCHEIPAGTSEVSPERCGVCHREDRMEGSIEDVALLHRAHVEESSVRCFECHKRPRHKAE